MNNRRNGWASVAVVMVTMLTGFVYAQDAVEPEAAETQSADAQQQDSDAKIARQVKLLGHPSYAKREKAMIALIEMGDVAKARLKILVAEQADTLTDEQKKSIESIIRDGAMIFLERDSGLDEITLDSLRRWRAGKIGSDEQWEFPEQVAAITALPTITDSGLALGLHAITVQTVRKGLDFYQCAEALKPFLEHKKAGEETLKKAIVWLEYCYLPAAKTSRWGSQPGSGEHEIATMLLSYDGVSADVFDQLVTMACDAASHPPDGEGHSSRIGHTFRGLVALANAGQANEKHIGRLIEALMIGIESDTDKQVEPRCTHEHFSLTCIACSPACTLAQKRVVIDWAMSRPDEEFVQYCDQMMRVITRTQTSYASSLPDPTDISARANELRGRWREWLDAQGDGLALPADGPAYRYVSVLVDLSDEKHPKITLQGNDQIRNHVGHLQYQTNGLFCGWNLLQPESFRPRNRTWIGETPHALVLTYVGFTTDHACHHEFPPQRELSLEQVRFYRKMVDEDTPIGDSKLYQMILVTDDPDNAITTEQLESSAFWAERLVSTAVAQAEAGCQPIKLLNADYGSLTANFGAFDKIILPGIQERVIALADHESDRVASMAHLQLVRSGWPHDDRRVAGFCKSDDPAVLLAIGMASAEDRKVENVQVLVDRLKTEEVVGPVGRVLQRLSRCHEFRGEPKRVIAVGIIKAALPEQESAEVRATDAYLLVKCWTDLDLGYVIGGDPVENSAALAKYHQWADDPDSVKPVTKAKSKPKPEELSGKRKGGLLRNLFGR